jgi:DNA-binding response OmpR family regulator
MKILVVDDDHELRALVAFALRNSGLLAFEAANGGEALALAEREQPALIVLDLNLGREDGLELLPRLRELSKAPVLVLSVRASEDDVVRGLDLGADDYLTKPFSPRTLIARVRALLRRSGAESAAEPLVSGAYRLELESRRLSVGEAPAVRLTPLELRMVQMLVASGGEVVASERLIAHVWGLRGEGDRQLLKQLVHRLRQKIEADPAVPARLVTDAGGYALR